MDMGNPILQTFEVGGQTRHLTFSEPPKTKSEARTVPAAIKRLIGELGLRYRPTSQTDLEAHAASLALLAVDLCDMPPHLLEKAIRQWVLKSPFLPKASDLIGLAKSIITPPPGSDRGKPYSAKELAKRRNESGEVPYGMMWAGSDEGDLWLETAA